MTTESPKFDDVERAVNSHGEDVNEDGTKRTLSARHIYFVSLAGGLGTGLFIGSGGKLSSGGPLSLLLGYGIVGVLVLSVFFALGELAAIFPVTGAFSTYATRFLDPAFGFAVGYNYWMQWITTLPLEFTAATILIQFWDDANHTVTPGVWIAIFIVLMVCIHAFGAKGYGEFELAAGTIKLLMVTGFIIMAIVVDCGGAPNKEYIGARYWHHPGPVQNKFKGFCTVFSAAAFAFQGTEIVGLAAAEAKDPHKNFPRVWKLVLLRIVAIYLVTLVLIGMVISPKDNRLVGGSDYDPHTSPFVLVAQIGQIRVLPHIINAVILLSALSVANGCVYGGSRSLLALAEQGYAPSFLGYVDRKGRPLPALLATLVFSGLAFLVYKSSAGDVFNWLIGISGLSTIFTYSVTCAAHIRFRAAWKQSGRSFNELPYISPMGVWFSWVGLAMNLLVLAANFYVGAFPIDEATSSPQDRAETFFQTMLSLVIVLVFYLGYKLVMRSHFLRLDEVDLDSGRRMADGTEVPGEMSKINTPYTSRPPSRYEVPM